MADHIRQIVDSPLTPKRENRVQRWLFHAFLSLLLLVPLPLASNRLWSWGFMEFLVAVLLAVWVGIRLVEYKLFNRVWSLDPAISQYRLAILLLFLGILYPLWQTIPWPADLLSIISPATLAIRQIAGATTLAGPISLDLHATLTEWLKGVAYFGTFWLTLVLTTSRNHLKKLTWVLLGSGAVQVGVTLFSMDPDSAFSVNGTFVNRNHFAGFLELILPLAIGLLLHRRTNKRTTQSWRDKLHDWLSSISGLNGVLAGLGVTMLLTLLLTQSRSGNASLFLSLLLMFGLFLLRRHKLLNNVKQSRSNTRKPRHFWGRFLVRLLLLIMLLMVGIWVGLGNLMGRYMTTDVQQDERWVVYTSAAGIVSDYPLFGSGSGTFALIFPHYQNAKLSDAFYDHAHNDHLEILADRGMVGYGLLAMGVAACWLGMARTYLRRREHFSVALLFASMMATLSLILHGITDFNFHIPANALYFMVILAIGLRGSVLKTTRHNSQR